MGYYTQHTLQVRKMKNGKPVGKEMDSERHEKAIESYSEYPQGYLWGDVQKWYDCDRDMKHYSAKHPNTLFIVTGHGEEEGDIWKAYYHNGKMQYEKAKISFSRFNSSKLT